MAFRGWVETQVCLNYMIMVRFFFFLPYTSQVSLFTLVIFYRVLKFPRVRALVAQLFDRDFGMRSRIPWVLLAFSF